MTAASSLRNRPWHRLTKHFFAGLFDFGVLTDAGSDAFVRLLIGIVAMILTTGLLLARMYLGKYAALAALGDRAAVRLTVLGDSAMTIGMPMLAIAFTTLMVSQSLFPDETDFRVLLVLPISRRVVFFSKLLALALFIGLFITATQVAIAPLGLQVSAAPLSGHPFLVRLAAHLVASVGASIGAVLALTAINGVLLLCVPRAHLQTASSLCRSAMLFGLVLAVPLAMRLPTIGGLLARESRLLYLAPPVWFLGVERVLLGDATPFLARLALVAFVTLLSSLALAIGTYRFLYRRFDRVMLRRAGAPADARWRTMLTAGGRRPRRPVFAAIGLFTRATLARSPLHQGVFVAVAACGAGLVMNSFIGLIDMGRVRSPENEIVNTVIAAPFTLVFVMVLAVRAALVLPIEPRANWVFRMTEDPASRTEQLGSVVHTVIRFGVVWPVIVLLPLQWAVLGAAALICAAIQCAAGLLLVEMLMADWRRIPFTCSYMPGKRFFGNTLLIGLSAFVGFTFFGWAIALYGRSHPAGALIVLAVAAAVVLLRRRERRHLWRHGDLIFEDVLPTEVEPLRLSVY